MSFIANKELQALGWNAEWQARFDQVAPPGTQPGRIRVEYQDRITVGTAEGDQMAMLSGLLRDVEDRLERPAVGDWVGLLPDESGHQTATVLVPRKSALIRRAAGDREIPQIIAANVDRIFVVTSLNKEFNARRLERYAAAIEHSGADMSLVLSKADLAPVEDFVEELSDELRELPLFVTSLVDGRGLDELEATFQPHETIAFVGSSGVGKSSLVNHLLGREEFRVAPIRHWDDRGQHTTRNRTLLPLPSGAILIDTPGIREIEPWDPDAAVGQTVMERRRSHERAPLSPRRRR